MAEKGAVYDTTCHECGDPIRVTGPRALWFHTDDVTLEVRAWHADCRLERLLLDSKKEEA